MEVKHCKTASSQVRTIGSIDWDEINGLLKRANVHDSVPPEGITRAKIMEKYGVSKTAAHVRYKKIRESGLYKETTLRVGGSLVKYLMKEVKDA